MSARRVSSSSALAAAFSASAWRACHTLSVSDAPH
nr:MAG TPA: hypothetical protein [Caudoviricetes sp.]